MATDSFSVRFWGVRGSIPCPGPETVRYGGNTSCLEVRCGPHLLIFDAGTGLRALGGQLVTQGPAEFDLYLTHTHFDHIIGLPFFAPMFNPGNRLRLWAGHLKPAYDLKYVLSEMMMAPLFPAPIEIFQARIEYHDFVAGDTLRPRDGVTLRTALLHHPNGATGYRIEYGERAIVYVTDTEHFADRPDDNIVGLARGADILIYDATYTDAEYPQYRGWGHSTWQAGMQVAEAAGVRQYVIFHHDPGHDDTFMDRVAAEAEAARPGTLVAREGMTLTPGVP